MQVAEYDTPAALIGNKQSIFHSLVEGSNRNQCEIIDDADTSSSTA
jgi:hypothetical protein